MLTANLIYLEKDSELHILQSKTFFIPLLVKNVAKVPQTNRGYTFLFPRFRLKLSVLNTQAHTCASEKDKELAFYHPAQLGVFMVSCLVFLLGCLCSPY